MVQVTATEFAKNFGRYKEVAQREPVAITSHGRTSGYFLSAAEYDAYQALKARARRAYALEALPEEILQDIVQARMDPAHDHLNAELDEEEQG